VTHGGPVFWQALGMMALGVGTAEWLTGSKRTALTFWGVHLVTLLTESWLIAPFLHLFIAIPADTLTIARDVGPSAGYFACLGLAIWQLPRRWRGWAAAALLTGLIATLVRPLRPNEDLSLKLFADIAHLIAFPLGFLSSWLVTAGLTIFKQFLPESSVLKGRSL
jgi:hypothetical protein